MLEVGAVVLTQSEPVPSVIPFEHHLFPFLHQLHQLLFDLTQAVMESRSYIPALLSSLKTAYYPLRICIVE